MKIDTEYHLGEVERKVLSRDRDGKPAKAVTLIRNYEISIDELWEALTNIERIPRWFLPVSGDLKSGGRYQLEGNASGTIAECQRPTVFSVTWEIHDDISWVEVRLEGIDKNATRLTLTHTAVVTGFWTQYGPGATGVGWELGLLGLALHIAYPEAPKMDEEKFSLSPQGKAFVTTSSEGWGKASLTAGTNTDEALTAVKRTTAFYTGEVSEG